MTTTLPQVAHEHHEHLIHHVDLLPQLGDLLITGTPSEVKGGIDEANMFLGETLVPHMEAAERALYPELERMLQNRHSMTPMKREHAEVRRLVAALAGLGGSLDATHAPTGMRLAARRMIFQLYALLKIHLAEEEAYLRIVEHGVSEEVADVLAAALHHPVSRPETASDGD